MPNKTYKFSFPREAMEIHRFVATSPERDNLRHILICPDDQRVARLCAVATNSHSMMIVRWPFRGEMPPALCFPGWIFRVAMLEFDEGYGFTGVFKDTKTPTMTVKHAMSYCAECIDAESYPTWPKALADQRKAGGDPSNRISLNPRKLAALADYLIACDIDGSYTRWSVPSDPLAGVRIDFTSGEVECSYVLMPCHVDDWTAK